MDDPRAVVDETRERERPFDCRTAGDARMENLMSCSEATSTNEVEIVLMRKFSDELNRGKGFPKERFA